MSCEFAVRTATPEDKAKVSELLTAAYPLLLPPSYDASVLAAALPVMTQANPTLLVADTYYLAETAEARTIGCGGWTRERPGEGSVAPGLGHIRHFGTHPEWLGRGVGRAIYRHCEERARTAGVQRFECYASLNAEGFYAALGFKSLRPIEIPIKPPDAVFPAILMARPI